MIILKKINNNFALALDDAGVEVVVYGRGIGFPKTPYNLEDESVIDRIFRDVEGSALAQLSTISEDLLSATADYVSRVSGELNAELNPNLFITLADHIQFAIERVEKGIVLESPLKEDISAVYPEEYKFGLDGLLFFHERLGIQLPEAEASLIALHLVSAQVEGGNHTNNMQGTMRSVRIVEQVKDIIEKYFDRSIDISSYEFRRFAAHLRYLIHSRYLNDDSNTLSFDRGKELVGRIRLDFPREYACARSILRLIGNELSCELSENDLLYLMMYVIRLVG